MSQWIQIHFCRSVKKSMENLLPLALSPETKPDPKAPSQPVVTTVVTITGHRFLSCYACPAPILINKLCAVPVTCIYVPTKSQALPLYCTCPCSLQLAAQDAHCSSCHQRKLPQNNSYIHSRKQMSKLGDFAIWEDWRQCSRTSQRHTSCSPELKQPQKILLFGNVGRVCGVSHFAESLHLLNSLFFQSHV